MIDFYIDVTDASGTPQGSGPITSALFWRSTARMDRAGSFSFRMPLSDSKASLITRKRRVHCYAILNGQRVEIGSGIVDQRQRVRDGDRWLLEVSGDDLLTELTYRSVRNLAIASAGAAISHSAAVAAAAAYAPAGWTITADPTPGHDALYGRFQGESVLAALVRLAEKSQSHFYLSGDRTLTFASTFAASGVRAIQAPPSGALAAETCAIVDLVILEESYDQISRVYPYGAGEGNARLTLAATSQTPPAGYTLDKNNNYIAYDALENAGERMERELTIKDLMPVSNSTADVQAAADALFEQALYYLQERINETATYRLRVAQCSQLLRPMQAIFVSAHDDDVDVEAALNILEATIEATPDGLRTTDLVVSTGERPVADDTTTLIEQVAQAQIAREYPQLNTNSYTTSYAKPVDETETATVRFRFGSEVTQLQQVLFDFELLPLESTVQSVGASTVTSSSGGSAVVTSAAGGGTTESTTSGGGATVTSASGGSAVVTSAAGGGTTESTTSGGGATVTSASGGSAVVTSAAGGGTTESTTSGGGATVTSASGGSAVVTSAAGGGFTSTSDGGGADTLTSTSGGGATVTSAGGGGTTVTSAGGGASAVTSQGGGATTETSSAGGAETVTSASGGSSTPTSGSGSSHTHTVTVPSHTHQIPIYDTPTPGSPSMQWLFFNNTTSLLEVGISGSGTQYGAVTNSSGGGSVETSSAELSHQHVVAIPAHTHDVTTTDHAHTVTLLNHDHVVNLPSHTHDVTLADHAHTVTIAAHDHNVSIPDHTHGLTIADHTHSVTVPAHTHDVTIAAHSHSVTLLDHTHDVTVPAHTHDVTIAAHSHSVTLLDHTHSVTVPAHTHDVTIAAHSHSVTLLDHTHSVTVPAHTHDVTIAAHSHSVTLLDHTHNVTVPAHTHDVTIAAHSHSVTLLDHTHNVTVPAHTHDVTPVINTVYGIYRESAGNTFVLSDLEYALNSGSWTGLETATDLGDGQYRLDLSAGLMDASTFRPLQEYNQLHIRRKTTGATGKTGMIDGLLSVRNVIQAIAYQ